MTRQKAHYVAVDGQPPLDLATHRPRRARRATPGETNDFTRRLGRWLADVARNDPPPA